VTVKNIFHEFVTKDGKYYKIPHYKEYSQAKKAFLTTKEKKD